jgi:act minimal PKS acyl carrier protein
MAEFTVVDLNRILRTCAGLDEAVSLDEAVQHSPFDELGYDSLAILELISRVQREYSMRMPDDATEHMETPLQAVEYVNSLLPEVHI